MATRPNPKPFTLRDIPDAMRVNGWKVGAAPSRRLGVLAIAAVALCLGIMLGAYAAGGASLSFSVPSPDRAERLDFYNANRWYKLTHPDGDMPGFVRLVRVAGDETLGTSGNFELSGSGPVAWSKDEVAVGTSAVFDRRTRRWDIQEY